jgi:hypothetical protein
VVIGDVMKLSRKINVRNISYLALTGGINNSVSGDLIADNEVQECENLIYDADSKTLTKRGGLSSAQISFDYDILKIFYDYEINIYFVFLVNGDIYKTDLNVINRSYIGKLAGNLPPICCKFGNSVWIASGDKLQFYNYLEKIQTVENSPLCDIVFERCGRLVVALAGDDNLHYSGVGDGEFWEENTDDDSAAVFLEIGYKDGGNIVAVLPLATDIIVLKSNGHVYQVTGEYPSWGVYLVGRFTDANYRFCAANIGNEIVFVSKRGLRTVFATQDYGNIQTSDIGDRFNSLITKSVHNPTVWHLKRQNSLLIRPAEGSYFIMYNYAVKGATVLTFPYSITDVAESLDGMVVAIGNSLHFWNRQYVNDNGKPIIWKIRPKKHLTTDKFLINRVDTNFGASFSGEVDLNIGQLNLKMPTLRRRIVKTNYSLSEIDLKLSSADDVIFNHVILEVADI